MLMATSRSLKNFANTLNSSSLHCNEESVFSQLKISQWSQLNMERNHWISPCFHFLNYSHHVLGWSHSNIFLGKMWVKAVTRSRKNPSAAGNISDWRTGHHSTWHGRKILKQPHCLALETCKSKVVFPAFALVSHCRQKEVSLTY